MIYNRRGKHNLTYLSLYDCSCIPNDTSPGRVNVNRSIVVFFCDKVQLRSNIFGWLFFSSAYFAYRTHILPPATNPVTLVVKPYCPLTVSMLVPGTCSSTT